MLLPSSASPSLTITSPTATTISFTVSTRPQRTTIPGHIAHFILLLARLLIVLAIFGLWWVKWSDYFPDESLRGYAQIYGWLVRLNEVVEGWRWRYLSAVGFVVLGIVVRRGYTEESLVVLRGLGIQTTSSSPTYMSTSTTRFIPTTSIQDIFIHEAFRGFEVRFYLCVVVEGEEDSVVVFPTLLPKRAILEEVWRGARKCLYEPSERQKS